MLSASVGQRRPTRAGGPTDRGSCGHITALGAKLGHPACGFSALDSSPCRYTHCAWVFDAPLHSTVLHLRACILGGGCPRDPTPSSCCPPFRPMFHLPFCGAAYFRADGNHVFLRADDGLRMQGGCLRQWGVAEKAEVRWIGWAERWNEEDDAERIVMRAVCEWKVLLARAWELPAVVGEAPSSPACGPATRTAPVLRQSLGESAASGAYADCLLPDHLRCLPLCANATAGLVLVWTLPCTARLPQSSAAPAGGRSILHDLALPVVRALGHHLYDILCDDQGRRLPQPIICSSTTPRAMHPMATKLRHASTTCCATAATAMVSHAGVILSLTLYDARTLHTTSARTQHTTRIIGGMHRNS
ncbi:hypothetical protein B0H14DRAFT_3733480 [Mycena olivaceomarginata]|nr:hypothetical protein B0H14DRAFT_3733480 [Mycena olivaceomarginata]